MIKKGESISKQRVSTSVKKKIFIEALTFSHYVIQPALDTAQINRGTYCRWLHNEAKFKEMVEATKESSIDFVERKLYKNISVCKEISTIFYLKTRAKHRGYVEATQLDITSGGDKIVFNFGGEQDVTNVNNPNIKITDVNDGEDNTRD